MSKLHKILAVLLVVAIVAAVVPANVAFAAKGGEKGKPSESDKGSGGEKGKPGETDKGAGDDKGPSNGSGDKKGPGESNGKNEARPDQDGKGADHGAVNDDKAWDGNNGCGNDKLDPDSPWEDDNNGKCKGLHKDRDGEEETPEEEGDGGGGKETTESDEGDDDFQGGGDEGHNDSSVRTQDAPTTVRVCFYSRGNAVEVSDADAGNILGFVVVEGGAAFEQTVIAEGWHQVCWDAEPGTVYHVLAWNSRAGHAGPLYRVVVTEDASGLVEIHNPFHGTMVVNGVVVTRMNPDQGRPRGAMPL